MRGWGNGGVRDGEDHGGVEVGRSRGRDEGGREGRKGEAKGVGGSRVREEEVGKGGPEGGEGQKRKGEDQREEDERMNVVALVMLTVHPLLVLTCSACCRSFPSKCVETAGGSGWP